MKGVRGAERKPLVMSEAERQVCWRKGSKGLLLGARWRLRQGEGKGQLADMP